MDLVHRDCSATWDYHQPTGKMNPESVEASIQGLLSALYPPFHATAPTLLSQLLQRIQERYQGDALRCLLNFLVPAKHILESVQQAACAPFSGVLFQSEGWPLCLGDRVVLQLAPLSPLLLRPGDFYLQVAPFSQQAARILVCSLLEEEELHQDRRQLPQVEETPIPETTYTCIFTSDWLREVNEGRRGTPLSHCLVVADQVVVRLPWEEVAQPRFVYKPRTMAPPPAPPPLPPTGALPRPAQQSSSGPSLPPCDSGFSVETRICPAKHGIAVSLCLVDRGASSRQTSVHRVEDTAQTRGWVSGHPWEIRCAAKGAPLGGVGVGTGGTTFWQEPKGEYVDLMEFTQKMDASHHSSQDQTETRTQEQECTQEPTHTQSCSSPHTLLHAHVQSRTHPWISLCRPSKPAPSPPAQHEPRPLHQQPAPLRESSQCAGALGYCEEPCSPCLRRRLKLQDSEGPWAPGLELNPGQEQSLGLGRGPSKAQELRCRYRESYQAALQNPVCFSREREKEEGREREKSTERENILTVAEEDCLAEGNLQTNGGGGEHSQHRSTALQHCSVTPRSSYRTPEQHFSGPQQVCVPTPIPGTAPVCSAVNTPLPPCKESSLCKESGEHCSVPCGTSWNVTSVPTAESERTGAVVSRVSADPDPDGRCSSLSTAVVDTSERCELVVQGRTLRRDRKGKGQRQTARGDSDDSSCSGAMVPRLHVVKCKNTTAFGLVSPKTNRRGKTCTEGTQACELPKPCSNQPESASQPQNQIPPRQHFQQQSFKPFTSRPEAPDRGLVDPCSLPLHLGLACLTGGRDRMGRAVVEVYSDRDSWRPQSRVSSQDLYQMLLYFQSITRQEIRELGMTIVIDARKTPPPPQFLQSVMMLQKQTFPVVHAVLVLESCRHPDTHSHAGLQTEVVSSLRALNKMVDSSQLTLALEGTLPYSHLDWLQLHKNLQPFVSDLQEASGLLLRSIERLEGVQRIGTVQEVQQSITGQRTLMRDILMDGRLVFLQREGGAILARLRRESDLRYPHDSDYSAALEAVAGLYSQVEEQAHILVRKSNATLEHLEYLLRLRHLEEHFTQIREWFTAEGERRLLEAEAVEDPRERVEQTLQSFCSFLTQAGEQQLKAESLVREAERLQTSSYPETEVFRTMVNTFQSVLAHFLSRAERCRWELEALLHICHFCQEATLLAEECRRYLEQDPLQDRDPAATLHSFQERFVQFSPDCFQEVKAQAFALRGSRGMRVWNVAWLRCQEVRQHLEERLGDLEQSWQPKQRHTGPLAGPWCAEPGGKTETAPPAGQEEVLCRSGPGLGPAWERPRAVSSPNQARLLRPLGGSSSNSPVVCCSPSQRPLDSPAQGSDATMTPSHRSTRKTEREARKGKNSRARDASLSRSHTIGCQWFPWQRGLGARSMSEESCAVSSSQSEAQAPSRRVLQAAQRFQISRHGSFCSQDSCSGTEGPGVSREATSSTRAVESSKALKLQHIVEELLLTEREYVRSLAYILTHYLPLLDRPDVPQDLRGKRALIFGNLERLYDFHHRHFLCELEACQREPLLVARCFLRHRESLGLYALYSKNKPQSDALILHHRHDIFKRKQVELGDLMDLPSYLLRPIQRISKYSLLLNDMLALWSPGAGTVSRESERAEIQAAADLVRFQMRHGNDLLTMDAIQDCDVNLQEQGELIRQDEFTVFYRRKRSIRRVFLFQHLILFSKTKKTNMGNDVYVYKQSFKTCDIGMTHTSGASGLCFEIWFRRRRAEDTYTLRADRSEVKAAWTADLDQLLWEQATHNREMRVQERLFMGLGRKSFQEIRPVSDRDVHPIPPGTVPAACHLTIGENVRPNSIGSGSSTSTSCSQSSSSSGRGSLPPVTYLGNQSQGPETNHIVCSCPEGVVDENLCNHHNLHHVHPHQKHRLHLLKDSSMSSGENVSALSNSEPSCLSGIGGDVVDSSSFTSQNSQLCATTANHKKSQSPGTSRRRPSLAPKPLGLIPSLGLTPSLGLKVTCGPPAADMT